MRPLSLALILFVSTQSLAVPSLPTNIPVTPDLALTPGDLCPRMKADEFRYPERIPYCRRDVSSQEKDNAFDRYDRKYGLRSKRYSRPMFKMDHFVSLCMGGSNDVSNLWPQHPTVALLTDPIEDLLCVQLRAGKIKQALAIDTIRKVKLNLQLAAPTLDRLINDTSEVHR